MFAYMICAAVVTITIILVIMARCNFDKECPNCKSKLNDESGFYQLIDLKPLTSQSEYNSLMKKSKYIHGTRCSRAVSVNYLKCIKCGWHSVSYDSSCDSG
jgi:hypothetical protein